MMGQFGLLIGRQMDTEVAEVIFGLTPEKLDEVAGAAYEKWAREHRGHGMLGNEKWEDAEEYRKNIWRAAQIEHYSTDMNWAWKVLEKMVELKWYPNIGIGLLHGELKYSAMFYGDNVYGRPEGYAERNTAAEAICLAAIDAMRQYN